MGLQQRSSAASLAAMQAQTGGVADKEKARRVAEKEAALRSAVATGEGEELECSLRPCLRERL